MRKEISYTPIALLMTLVVSMFAVPIKAFVYPDGTTDSKYELYGPHADQLVFQMYGSTAAMWTAQALGQIDLNDWPLTVAWRVQSPPNGFLGDPNNIVVSAGGGTDFFTIDFNQDPNEYVPNSARAPYKNPVWIDGSAYTPPYSLPGIPPVTTNVYFRLACGNLFGRAAFASFLGSAGYMIMTPIPAYMATYIWTGATGYTFSTATALSNLALGGFRRDAGSGNQWYWDYNNNGVSEPAEIAACQLKMTWRQDDYRAKAGQMLYTGLLGLGFTFARAQQVTGDQDYNFVMLNKDYHIATLGWSGIGPDPDYLYDLYHVSSFWDDPTSSCPNTADLDDTILNTCAAGIKFAATQSETIANCTLFQMRFEAICAQIPLYSSNRYMASAKYYTGGNAGVPVSPDDGENVYRRPILWVEHPRPPSSDWPMFHHDLNHTGYSASTAPSTNDTLWSYKLSSIGCSSSPAVVSDRLYVGSDGGNVTCLDALTGAFIWNYTTGDQVISSPTVTNGKVYVGSADGNVYCLNASTGAKIWNYTIDSSPVFSSPAVSGDKAYVGSWAGNFTCLDATTGSCIWSITTNRFMFSSPAVVGDKIYVGTVGNITCLDALTGATVWNYASNSVFVPSSPAVVDGKVYAGTGTNVTCLDALTGAFMWNYTTDGGIFSSPAVADGIVFVGSSDSNVYALNASVGTLVWNYTTDAPVDSSPAFADGKIYVGSHDCDVYCFNALNGQNIWISHVSHADVFSSPAVADTMVYVGSYDGNVYAFGKMPADIIHYGNGREWIGLGDQTGLGSNTWFSYLNMWPNSTFGFSPAGTGSMTIRYGWSSQSYPEHINPFYSEWYWDSIVLGSMYDTPGYRDPYSLTTWKPDLIKNWTIGTWQDPMTGDMKSKVILTLRPGVYWSDGQPMTIADVIFSLVEAGPMLLARGYQPPWWWPTGSLVRSLSQVDCYTIEILYDVRSYWVESWTLGGFHIVPKHIWYPIINSGNPTGVSPDPNSICSGPWRYKSWIPASILVMVANKPGSTVTTDRPGATPITSPYGYHNYYPLYVNIHATNPVMYRSKVNLAHAVGVAPTPASSSVSWEVDLVNRMQPQAEGASPLPLQVSEVVDLIDGTTGAITYSSGAMPATVLPGDEATKNIVTFTTTINKGNHFITVNATITGPTTIDGVHPNPFLGHTVNVQLEIWITIAEDIKGTVGFDPLNTPSEVPMPDCKVNILDVQAAAGAFGTSPGAARWNTVADITGTTPGVPDYKINILDIVTIARMFGKW